MIRTKGRISKNTTYENEIINPVLLAKNHNLTENHKWCKHLGIQATLNKIRLSGLGSLKRDKLSKALFHNVQYAGNSIIWLSNIPKLEIFLKAESISLNHIFIPVASAPGPVLDFGPERGPGKGTMADLGPLIRHLVSTRLPSGGRAAFLSPLSPLYRTRPCV